MKLFFLIRKENTIMKIVNVVLMGAIAPPGGGRNNITSRFSRHFNILSIESFDDNLMRTIFVPIMQWYFQKSAFPESYSKYIAVLMIQYFLVLL